MLMDFIQSYKSDTITLKEYGTLKCLKIQATDLAITLAEHNCHCHDSRRTVDSGNGAKPIKNYGPAMGELAEILVQALYDIKPKIKTDDGPDGGWDFTLKGQKWDVKSSEIKSILTKPIYVKATSYLKYVKDKEIRIIYTLYDYENKVVYIIGTGKVGDFFNPEKTELIDWSKCSNKWNHKSFKVKSFTKI